MRLKTIIFLAVIALCFASCGRSFCLAERFLDEAEAKLETQPDSAFVELDSLDRSLLGTKELRARHALLYTIALEKVGMEITSDSIINIAVDYYSTSGDEAMKEKALYYKNIIDQNAASVHKDTLAASETEDHRGALYRQAGDCGPWQVHLAALPFGRHCDCGSYGRCQDVH